MPTQLTNDDLVSAAREVIPGGVNSVMRRLPGLEDLTAVAASGSRFRTADGVELVDFLGGWGSNLLGFADPDVNAAAAEAAKTIGGNIGFGVNHYEVALAEKVVEHIPSAESVALCNSGSEATFHAIRLARVATGRQKIVKFQGAYHGWHDSVAMNGVDTPFERLNTRDPYPGVHPALAAETIIVPFNDLDFVERVFAEHSGQIAAIIVEPVLHALGNVLPRDGFHQGLQAIAKSQGAVFIFDEVVTGFRHAVGGFQSLIGLDPDLTTFGKGIANGYPIAGVAGKKNLLDDFATNPGGRTAFGGTYNGNPVAAAAAVATIDKLIANDVHAHLFRLGDRLRHELKALYLSLGVDAVVSGFGSSFNTYFLSERPILRQEDLRDNDRELYINQRLGGLRHGVFEVPMNLKRSVISGAHSDADIDRLLEATEQSVKAIISDRAS